MNGTGSFWVAMSGLVSAIGVVIVNIIVALKGAAENRQALREARAASAEAAEKTHGQLDKVTSQLDGHTTMIAALEHKAGLAAGILIEKSRQADTTAEAVATGIAAAQRVGVIDPPTPLH